MTTPTITVADHIEDLLRRGFSLKEILGRGLPADAVTTVLRANDWDLDAHGRLPVGKRVTTPVGLRKVEPGPLIVRPAAEREPVAAAPVKRSHRKRKAPPPPPIRPAVASVTKLPADDVTPAPRSDVPPVAQDRPAAPKRTKGGPAGLGARAVREHGTRKGYGQHYRLGDKPPCQECKDAWNTSTRVARAGTKGSTRTRPKGREVGGMFEPWLQAAQRHTDPDVAQAAARAIGALMALRIAVDGLHAAERRAVAHDLGITPHDQEATA